MSNYLFPELETDARERREALVRSQQAAPPPDARGWHLRSLDETGELASGWNDPFPPKRGWSVHHYYRERRSLCGDYHYTTPLPATPHFQNEDPSGSFYAEVAQDWLCKICLVHRLGQIQPTIAATSPGRVIDIRWFEPYDFYIGRANSRYKLSASMWANPDQEARRKSPAQAREEFIAHIRSHPALVAALADLRGKVLACWCKRRDREVACHGDWLLELAEGRA